MKQQPRLMRGGLSGRIYVVTRYRELGNGGMEALEKHDVTEDFETLTARPPADERGIGWVTCPGCKVEIELTADDLEQR